MQNTFWKVWLTPLILAVLSLIGLLSALTGDGVWDLLSWMTLGIPVVVMVWFLSRSGKVKKAK